MQKNDYFEGTCIDLTHEAQGVVKVEGVPYFVKGMLIGEVGKLKVVKQLKNYGIARLIELKKASSERVEPRCPVYNQCGGCHLQHLSATAQKQFKQKRVQDVMQRIAKVDCEVAETLMQEDPWFYRNKVQMPVGYVNDKLATGFYKQHSNDIIPTECCYIQNKVSNALVNRVRELMVKYNVTPYDKIKGKGTVRHILTKYGFKTNELMLVLVTNGEKFAYKKEFIDVLTKEFKNLKTIVQNINQRRDNVILGGKEHIWHGNGYIQDILNGLTFNISAKSFYQINPPQVEALYNKAIELADIQPTDTVIDAYCGIGTISLFMASKAKKVIGVEIVPTAIKDAKNNAKMNNIKNVDFIIDDAADYMVSLAENNEHIDIVMVDPPRKGCSTILLDAVVKLKPRKLVYVSCDPSTQARDIAYLSQNGYKISGSCQPVDLFAQTYGIENIAVMVKE